jgi:hypothetical protein
MKAIFGKIWRDPKMMDTPFCNHPFIDGIFHEINHPAMGVPPKILRNPHAI